MFSVDNELTCNIIEIRSVSLFDIQSNEKALKSLLEQNFRVNFSAIEDLRDNINATYNNILQYQSDGSAIIIGAFKGMNLIGFLWAYKREIMNEQRLHVVHIVVDKEERSSGAGTRMLKSLENTAQLLGIRKIELITSIQNEVALQFYKSKGFEAVRIQLEKELGK